MKFVIFEEKLSNHSHEKLFTFTVKNYENLASPLLT